jgi:S1-C subfamily serine protease
MKHLILPAVLVLAAMAAPVEAQGRAAPEVERQRYDGLKITYVYRGSPAEEAGLEAGDVLLEAEGVPLDSVATLRHALRDADEVELTIINRRNGRIETVIAYPRHGRLGIEVRGYMRRSG